MLAVVAISELGAAGISQTRKPFVVFGRPLYIDQATPGGGNTSLEHG